jgi:hypothetical protein
MPRSAKQVFEDHLRKRLQGNLEEDLARNYAEDVVLLTTRGTFHGKDGVRNCARVLLEELPCPRYRYRTKLVNGNLAFLEWSAQCAKAHVDDGADSYLIRDGRIVGQTIHYTVQQNDSGQKGSSKRSKHDS